MGYARRELLGKTLTTLYAAKDRARYSARSTSSLRGSGYWSGEVALQRNGGALLWHDVRMILHTDDSRPTTYLIVIARDAREKRALQHQAWKAKSSSEQILESMADAVLVIDRNGLILSCNDAFARMLGTAREDIIGIAAPYPWLNIAAAEKFAESMKRMRRGGAVSNAGIIWRRFDHFQISTLMSFSILRDSSGKAVRYVVTLRDISNFDYQEQLRRSEERIQLLLTDLQRKTITLQTLLEIQHQILGAASLTRIFREIVTGVQKLLRHDIAGIYLIDEKRTSLSAVVLSRKNIFTQAVRGGALPIGHGLVGIAALTGKMHLVNNAHMDPRSIYPNGRKPSQEHVIVVPLRVRNTVFGVLAVARNSDPEFYDEDAQVIQSFAEAATVALENARIVPERKGNSALLQSILVQPASRLFRNISGRSLVRTTAKHSN